MKFAVVILALVAVASAQFSNGQYNSGRYNAYSNQYNQYNPFNAFNRNRYRQPYSTPTPYRFPTVSTPAPTVTIAPLPVSVSSTPAPVPVIPVSVPVVPKVYNTNEFNAETLRSGNDISPDGSFNYFFETENGIAVQEEGVPRTFGGNPPVSPVVVQGRYSYTSPEGQPIDITYVADENGYQPSGAAIPTSPPLPPQIARALAYTAKYHAVQK